MGAGRTCAFPEDGSGVAHEKLSHEFIADEPGYVYIYLSNDGSLGSGEVFSRSKFGTSIDDFEINSSESYIVQTIDYYPYGLVASNWKRESEKATKVLFQEGRALINSPVDCFSD